LHHRTAWWLYLPTKEYARGLLDFKNGRCDTGLLTTTVWSNVLFGTCPAWIYTAAEATSYDLYLVTDIDVPWVDDN